jgi:shikimate kinase
LREPKWLCLPAFFTDIDRWRKTDKTYLVGFMGAGKTTVARALARRLDWRVDDIDEHIERRERKDIASIFRQHGEPYFRAAERAALIDLLPHRGTVVASGGGTFADAGNRELMLRDGMVIWLDDPVATILEQVPHAAAGPRPIVPRWRRLSAPRRYRSGPCRVVEPRSVDLLVAKSWTGGDLMRYRCQHIHEPGGARGRMAAAGRSVSTGHCAQRHSGLRRDPNAVTTRWRDTSALIRGSHDRWDRARIGRGFNARRSAIHGRRRSPPRTQRPARGGPGAGGRPSDLPRHPDEDAYVFDDLDASGVTRQAALSFFSLRTSGGPIASGATSSRGNRERRFDALDGETR